MNYMNTKQIAELCEKSVQTILNWINRVFPTKVEDGKETQLSLDEVRQLFDKAFGSKISSMLMESATSKTLEGASKDFGCQVPQNAAVPLTLLADQVAAQGALLAKVIRQQDVVINEMRGIRSKQLLLEDTSTTKEKMLLDIKKSIVNLSLKTDRQEDDMVDEVLGKWAWQHR